MAVKLSFKSLINNRNKFKLLIRNRYSIIEKIINRIPLLNRYYNMLLVKFRIALPDERAARNRALLVVQLYFVGVAAVLIFTLQYTKTWYILLLNVVLAAIIPYVIINTYLSNLLNKAIKQLPNAIDELESGYFKGGTLQRGIEIALTYMPREVEPSFRNLYFNMMRDYEHALKVFKEAYSHPYIDSLASLFSIYYKKGGQIEKQLQYLNNMVQSDLTIRDYTKSSLIKYKILAGVTVFLVPFAIIVNTKFSANIENFLLYTLEGNTIIALAIASAVIYFIFVEILERI